MFSPASVVRQRVPLLIGGPLDGEQRVIEPRQSHFMVPVSRGLPHFLQEDEALTAPFSYDTAYYVKHRMAFKASEDRVYQVTFFGHEALGGERATEKLWLHLMGLAGAYPEDQG